MLCVSVCARVRVCLCGVYVMYVVRSCTYGVCAHARRMHVFVFRLCRNLCMCDATLRNPNTDSCEAKNIETMKVRINETRKCKTAFDH